MQKIYKEEQVDIVARKLNLQRVLVKSIIDRYIDIICEEVNNGRSAKVFNMCYLVVKTEKGCPTRKTLAYIANDIGRELSVGGVTVLRVLNVFEEVAVDELKDGNGLTLRGLIRVQTIEENGSTRLRIRKTTNYNGCPVVISTMGSFRRRVLGGG